MNCISNEERRALEEKVVKINFILHSDAYSFMNKFLGIFFNFILINSHLMEQVKIRWHELSCSHLFMYLPSHFEIAINSDIFWRKVLLSVVILKEQRSHYVCFCYVHCFVGIDFKVVRVLSGCYKARFYWFLSWATIGE